MLLTMIFLLVLAIIAVPVLTVLIGVGGPVLVVLGEVYIFVSIIVCIIKSIVKSHKK